MHIPFIAKLCQGVQFFLKDAAIITKSSADSSSNSSSVSH